MQLPSLAPHLDLELGPDSPRTSILGAAVAMDHNCFHRMYDSLSELPRASIFAEILF